MKNSKDESVTIEQSRELINEAEKPGNFEDAIKATGFGKFNIALLCVIIPGAFAQIVEQTSSAYVIPIAQCDLKLSLEQKGVLVAISYTGMISSSFLWGYICDTYGRRKTIVYGFIGNAACYLLAALSQNFPMFLMSRFLSGFIYTGPFTAFTSYLSEFHSSEYRSRVQLIRGLASGIAVIILPMIAWLILPHVYDIQIFGVLSLHSWNFFVAICCIPALATGITFIFMPESPKFLLATGKTDKALKVFKKVYKKNTGRRFSSFPIKTLEEDNVEESNIESEHEEEQTVGAQLMSGLTAMKPLFLPPHLFKLIHTSATGVLVVLGAFSVKMWYPQILQSINDYEDSSSAEICNILDSLAVQNTSDSTVCTVNLDNSSVYINASILGTIQLVAFFLAGIVVNKIGKKALAVSVSCCAASCPILIYLIPNSTIMMGLFPLIIAFSEVTANILLTITMEVFPTSFRTTATNLNMMVIRIGIFSGNMAMPYLLKTGCLPTILFISVALFGASGSISLLPNTDNKELE